jgi:uncharacterized protein with PIN domain
MSDECLDESPGYRVEVNVKDLFIALARCPECDRYPMIQIAVAELLCPSCRKQFYEGPNHNFIRQIYEWTEDNPNSKEKEFDKVTVISKLKKK